MAEQDCCRMIKTKIIWAAEMGQSFVTYIHSTTSQPGERDCHLDAALGHQRCKTQHSQACLFEAHSAIWVRRGEIMVLLEKLWDDVLAGPQPERGLGRLRKIATPLNVKDLDGEGSSKYQKSLSMPATPSTPATPTTPISPNSPAMARKDNVWRSVFHPGSNLATKTIGANVFDKPQPNSPTVYDWLYSGETRSKHR